MIDFVQEIIIDKCPNMCSFEDSVDFFEDKEVYVNRGITWLGYKINGPKILLKQKVSFRLHGGYNFKTIFVNNDEQINEFIDFVSQCNVCRAPVVFRWFWKYVRVWHSLIALILYPIAALLFMYYTALSPWYAVPIIIAPHAYHIAVIVDMIYNWRRLAKLTTEYFTHHD